LRPRFSLKRRRDPVLELLVIEGRDTGQQYTIDEPEVRIGRGAPQTGCTNAIFLSDSTVSSQQATIRKTEAGALLEHREGATNPTRVNGQVVRQHRLRPGDRIQVGLTVLEVRERNGIALSDLTQVLTETRPTQVYHPVDETTELREPRSEITEVRCVGGKWGQLTVVRGLPDALGKTFSLKGDKVVIGRSPDCDVSIPERGVSRTHAELRRQGGRAILVHRSAVNETFVDGLPVEGERVLGGGEEIQLADKVVLKVELEGLTDTEATQARPAPARRTGGSIPTSGRVEASTAPDRNPGLITAVHEQIKLQKRIEEEFQFQGSFLDVDVVDSYGMKARADRPDRIIHSFDRFREFARGLIEEFDGSFLNCNGDEIMSFFESAHQAVRCGSAFLRRLEEFNEKENVLDTPFRVRIGIHTGQALVDRQKGVAYSTALDVAGHLQKMAPVDSLLISEQTHEALPAGLPLEPAGTLEREGFPTYRLAGPID
jgi:pSer/pThr/pTyr-binding forkhead associated (FHA) protein